MVLRRRSPTPTRATMGASLAIAAVLLTPFAAAAPPAAAPSGEAIGALLVLGLVCTAAAFVDLQRPDRRDRRRAAPW